MRFRLPSAASPPGFQITPMVDIFCCLLIFFIVTYNFSRDEMALEVKVPTASPWSRLPRISRTRVDPIDR